jgi:curved DNA-binding protein CbpA
MSEEIKKLTEEEIKQAFRRQAMKHHPDRGGDSVLFQDINEAYSVLSDRQKRAAYDNPHQFRNININMNLSNHSLTTVT